MNLFVLSILFSFLPFCVQAIEISDNVLCRLCGSDILSPEYIVSKPSPEALNTYNETLFNKSGVIVQTLLKDYFFQLPIITATHSSCLGIDEWSEDELWYTNYQWKPCICSECGSHIGWIFQDNNNQIINSTDEFFALNLANLIGESCKVSWYLLLWERTCDCLVYVHISS